MTATPDLDRGRLVKLLGLTGSQHDAEALAALRKAQMMMRAGRVDWTALISEPLRQLEIAAAAAQQLLAENERLRVVTAASPPGSDWRPVDGVCRHSVDQCIDECRRQRHRLTDWENRFIRTLAEFRYEPSAKQLGCLERICRKLGVD
jgi:PAS domain-containing protein